MIQKQIQLDALEEIMKDLEERLRSLNRDVGGIEEKIRKTNEDISLLRAEYASEKASYLELGANAGEQLLSWNSDYEKQTSDKTFEKFRYKPNAK